MLLTWVVKRLLLPTPTNAADLTTKTYVDGILGSATATSATAAASSATAAASSATAAASSATSAASSATSAAASYDSFDDRYLGAKSSAPTVDNDGDALIQAHSILIAPQIL